MNRIQATPELKAMMVRMNTEPLPVWTSEQFKEMIARDLLEWKKIAADAKIKVTD